ncbi:MAG: hypothetical protein QM501_01880 [Gimesia sp.]
MAEVDANEALKTMQTTTLALIGSNAANLADFQSRVFLRMESQLDPIDAAVATQIAASSQPAQFAGLNAASQTPGKTQG